MKRAVPAVAAMVGLVAVFLASAALAQHGATAVKTTKQPFLVGTAPDPLDGRRRPERPDARLPDVWDP